MLHSMADIGKPAQPGMGGMMKKKSGKKKMAKKKSGKKKMAKKKM